MVLVMHSHVELQRYTHIDSVLIGRFTNTGGKDTDSRQCAGIVWLIRSTVTSPLIDGTVDGGGVYALQIGACAWANFIIRKDIENHAGKWGNCIDSVGSARNKLSMYIHISFGSSTYALFGALYLKNWMWHFQRPCTFITWGRHGHSQQWSTFDEPVPTAT